MFIAPSFFLGGQITLERAFYIYPEMHTAYKIVQYSFFTYLQQQPHRAPISLVAWSETMS